MIRHLYYTESASFDPYYNLALEQVLMEQLPEDSCLMYLWQNRQTVVIGRNQNAWKECRTEQLQADGGLLARRQSGGGAVYHDTGNLNFTFIASRAHYDVRRQLSVILEACRTLGIPAEISGRNDLLAAGRKFSGNAFRETAEKASHHGTLLISADMSMLSRYLRPSQEKLRAKGVNSVEARVVNLAELHPGLTVGEMKQQLRHSFETIYGGTSEYYSVEEAAPGAVEQLRAQYASWEWIYGKDLAFTMKFGTRFSWGEIEVQLEISSGLIRDVRIYSDALDWQFAPALEAALTGCRVSLAAMQGAVQTLNCETVIREDLSRLFQEQDW